MKFSEAFDFMTLEGKKIKRSTWQGFWRWDNEAKTIFMHCRDGRVLDIRQPDDVHETFQNCGQEDWEVVNE